MMPCAKQGYCKNLQPSCASVISWWDASLQKWQLIKYSLAWKLSTFTYLEWLKWFTSSIKLLICSNSFYRCHKGVSPRLDPLYKPDGWDTKYKQLPVCNVSVLPGQSFISKAGIYNYIFPAVGIAMELYGQISPHSMEITVGLRRFQELSVRSSSMR